MVQTLQSSLLFSCSFSRALTKSFPTLVKMLMEGNEGTFYVVLHNRELTSLDKVLLRSPTRIVIPRSPKFYLQFISIFVHTFNVIEI